MIAPDIFINLMKKTTEGQQPEPFKLGTIPGDYAAGRPAIQFDGEDAASVKTYPYLDSYVPTANDRVLLALVGHTWVILGQVI